MVAKSCTARRELVSQSARRTRPPSRRAAQTVCGGAREALIAVIGTGGSFALQMCNVDDPLIAKAYADVRNDKSGLNWSASSASLDGPPSEADAGLSSITPTTQP